ncbi:LuxR family transcriptional regulator [Paenibacillus sp. Soil766]|uniref:response regulator transcription factor n=1 Tax=Paenibacillus sp. Soil766 TaxID=1736404 RepID=UPI00070FB8F2|nr:response regulator transcription factor [Paenibacillus sp. Soil766]KRF10063.1 LuxR family transcriptional regulator [Paenibacillus sp. Soil766]
MIQMIIADNQALMRDGLKALFNFEDDMKVLATAENGLQAYDLVKQYRPELVIMDIHMPLMNGIESTKCIKKDFPNTLILILTTVADEDYIVEALLNGASGYLLKDMPGDKLFQSVRDASKGQLMMPAEIASKLAKRLSFLSGTSQLQFDPNKLKNEHIAFTDRENKIIQLMIEGKSNREIADTVFMSEGTIKNYISVIYGKIGTSDRLKAVICLKRLCNQQDRVLLHKNL